MKAVDIARWDARTRRSFSYVADKDGDTWRSHAAEVLADEPWADDCDGLAETCLDLCCRTGLKTEDAYRLAVFASSDGSGHMVGCAKDDDGQLWIVGDTFSDKPYLASHMRHRPNVYNRLAEDIWREGAPWRLE